MAKLINLRSPYRKRAEAVAEGLRQELLKSICRRWPITGTLRHDVEQLSYDQLLQFYNELSNPSEDQA
jgi:hypothetical protein